RAGFEPLRAHTTYPDSRLFENYMPWARPIARMAQIRRDRIGEVEAEIRAEIFALPIGDHIADSPTRRFARSC
ncbi:MAG: hypothetical protein WAM44_10390, partial [Chthoniobacterales bacterium]